MNEWQENTGEMPVHGDTRVDVMFEDGYEDYGQSASHWRWTIGGGYDIEKWRFHEEEDGWIVHEGDSEKSPVSKGTRIQIKCRDGEVTDTFPAYDCIWWDTLSTTTGDWVAFRFADAEKDEDDIVKKTPEPAGEMTKDTLTKGETTKDVSTNPKAQFGAAKLPLSLWPELATAYGCIALANGAFKYGKANFLGTPVLLSTYMDGLKRHIAGFMSGEEFDPVDGQPHLSGMLANTAIIITARAQGTLIDDRPIGSGYTQELDALTEVFNNIKELHKDKNPFHYTLNNMKEGNTNE